MFVQFLSNQRKNRVKTIDEISLHRQIISLKEAYRNDMAIVATPNELSQV
jgi:hypothetical protein